MSEHLTGRTRQPLPSAVSAPATPEEPRPRPKGSPLIAPGPVPAVLTCVLALLVAGGAQLGALALAAAVALLQAVTAAGWYRLNGMWPARQGIALAFLAGLATDTALLLADEDRAPLMIIGTLGAWCVLTLVLHLRNTSAPDERMYALTAAFAATALTVLAAGHLAALGSAGGDAVSVAACAAAATALVRALPLPRYVSPVVAALAGAGAGTGVGRFLDFSGAVTALGSVPAGAVFGLAAGCCALLGLRVASYDHPSRFVHMTAGVALPLALAAPAVHLLGRVVV